MCGIVGYIGLNSASTILLNGLEKLEYRGYDSAGVTILNNNKLTTRKFSGRLERLADSINQQPIAGTIGIGHTRWATHGEPSDVNSHPQLNNDQTIAIVHNGIIENYLSLKNFLTEQGYTFYSETDTEIIANLIGFHYENDLFAAVRKAIKQLKGTYALEIVSSKHPDEIIAVRYESPLVLGIGEDAFYLASDIPAILNQTKKVIYLENGDLVRLTKEDYEIYDQADNKVEREIKEVTWDVEAASKEGFDHFMLKEIYQQPEAIQHTIERRLDDEGYIQLDDIQLSKLELNAIRKVYIVACGTAYHAGLVGKHILEKALQVDVNAEIGSEFRYNDQFIDDKTLVIIVSQSGETADTLASLREAKSKGARILSITNVVGSSVARESDDIFYTWAGPEIAVASTKAYTTQLVAFYMLGLYFGRLKGTLSDQLYKQHLNELQSITKQVERTINNCIEPAKVIAEKIKDSHSLFYLGRGLDYTSALEASLKLKELSYIHAEAFAAGELKHGTIALIEEGTPVIAIATQTKTYDKTISNIKSVKARGAYVIGITTTDNEDIEQVCDKTIYIAKKSDLFMPILSVIAPQLIAYYTSLAKGNDVDKPRNLAKSVTVE
ncbi:glutamine--fructose-6-phosphate transaminase (isomerizing) [Amphibacillus indicireducens]|uniref:Glutamine--fructose-6-phosphate aminotransferase [isomerizing] n=1 Tax=Amphibacillus indicireducens TaxID=1076330 RepID=A0ABP7VDG7_9BACI